MKTAQKSSNRKVRTVTIDAALNEQQVLFPEKLERANEMLKTAKLPPKKILNAGL